MSSTDFELDDNYDDDVSFDEASNKINAKESLEKRRLIDDLLAQRRLERELKDFDYDFDSDEVIIANTELKPIADQGKLQAWDALCVKVK